MAVVKIGWSGGKDSTCAVMQHILRGDDAKIVCYVPMFNSEIPLITKKHYEFIKNTADYFKSLGAQFYWADDGLTYCEYVTHIAISGKHRGKMFGFPYFGRGQCGFKRDGKLRACNKCDVGYYDYESIGIAFDEVLRYGQLNDNKRSILVELKITEQDAENFCKDNCLYSPHYNEKKKCKVRRDGCALCCNASEKERLEWFSDYPEALPIVIELQNLVKKFRPDRPPLRGYKYFI